MTKPNDHAVHTFVKFVLSIFANGPTPYPNLVSATNEALRGDRFAEAKTFFAAEGFDQDNVSRELLADCAVHVGWHSSQYAPQRSFADMAAAIEQHNVGVLSDAELIRAVQLSPIQAKAVDTYLGLPQAIQLRVSLAEFDTWVDDTTAKCYN